MRDKELSEPCYRQQVRQQVSVPFLWEEKPGKPKKGWRPEKVPVTSVPSLAKLVASVPFQWEEKPGKPLLQISQPLPNAPLLPIPPESGDDESMLELDLKAFDFNKDYSFDSSISLLANRLLTTTAESSAVPGHQSLAIGGLKPQKNSIENTAEQLETWALSLLETASDSTSLVAGNINSGTSVLEFLFPMFSPDSGFLDKISYHKKGSSIALTELSAKDNSYTSDCSVILKRKTPTLGELILMSRKLSYARKAIPNRKRSLSMGFTRKRAFAWCIC
ncbi:hydroxyproline-rich glycoprotein family protein [Tasmannia lanceolata]|uniref:hydroxyproline-rich glycoprotein family protein n=1 Tax=Tasmannia lanceolata TaxID=3420 RepID=UPI0040638CA3